MKLELANLEELDKREFKEYKRFNTEEAHLVVHPFFDPFFEERFPSFEKKHKRPVFKSADIGSELIDFLLKRINPKRHSDGELEFSKMDFMNYFQAFQLFSEIKLVETLRDFEIPAIIELPKDFQSDSLMEENVLEKYIMDITQCKENFMYFESRKEDGITTGYLEDFTTEKIFSFLGALNCEKFILSGAFVNRCLAHTHFDLTYQLKFRKKPKHLWPYLLAENCVIKGKDIENNLVGFEIELPSSEYIEIFIENEEINSIFNKHKRINVACNHNKYGPKFYNSDKHWYKEFRRKIGEF